MAPLSEYRRKFKQKGEASQKDYVVRYNYMVGRRSTEMSHTPIDWEVASDTDSEISSSRSDLAPVKNKAVEQQPDPKNKDESTSTHDVLEAARPLAKFSDAGVQCGKNNIKNDKNEKNKKQGKSKSCKRTDHKPTRAKTADQSKKGTTHGHKASNNKAPLIPYGWAYRGPIDNHKTFNVKVPEKEASQSALRALKRRQLDMQKKEEEKQQQALQRKSTQALFDLVEKDKSGCMS